MDKVAIKITSTANSDTAKEIVDNLKELGYDGRGVSGCGSKPNYYFIEYHDDSINYGSEDKISHCTIYDSLDDFKQHLAVDKPKTIDESFKLKEFAIKLDGNVRNAMSWLDARGIENQYKHTYDKVKDVKYHAVTSHNRAKWFFRNDPKLDDYEEVYIPKDMPETKDPKKVAYKCDGTREHYDAIIEELVKRGIDINPSYGKFKDYDRCGYTYLRKATSDNSIIWDDKIPDGYYEDIITPKPKSNPKCYYIPSSEEEIDMILDYLLSIGGRIHSNRSGYHNHRLPLWIDSENCIRIGNMPNLNQLGYTEGTVIWRKNVPVQKTMNYYHLTNNYHDTEAIVNYLITLGGKNTYGTSHLHNRQLPISIDSIGDINYNIPNVWKDRGYTQGNLIDIIGKPVLSNDKYLFRSENDKQTIDLIIDHFELLGYRTRGISRQPFYDAKNYYIGIDDKDNTIVQSESIRSWSSDHVVSTIYAHINKSNLPVSQGILTHDASPNTKLYFKGDGTKETVDKILDYLGHTSTDRDTYYRNASMCIGTYGAIICHGKESSWIRDGYVAGYLPTQNGSIYDQIARDREFAYKQMQADMAIAREMTRTGHIIYGDTSNYINNLNSNQNGKDGTICKVQRPTPQIGQAVTRRGSIISSRRSKASIG